jgi:hypothetical protein
MNRITKWEYNAAALNYTGATDLTILDNMGKEGWELCGIKNDHVSTAYFKRPIVPLPKIKKPIPKRKYKQ